MRRSEKPWNVSTYVRRELSVTASSTVGPPRRLAQRMLKSERSDCAPMASGEYISIQTQREELEDGTKRSDGVKSTEVTPLACLTSACTFSVVCSGVQG